MADPAKGRIVDRAALGLLGWWIAGLVDDGLCVGVMDEEALEVFEVAFPNTSLGLCAHHELDRRARLEA